MFSEQIQEKGKNLLNDLVGAQLSSVQFVLNYLILGFNEKGALTTLVWPEVVTVNGNLNLGTPGYRDYLCELIGKIVKDTEFTQDEIIKITFEDGRKLAISLREYKQPGERVILTGPKHRLFVW